MGRGEGGGEKLCTLRDIGCLCVRLGCNAWSRLETWRSGGGGTFLGHAANASRSSPRLSDEDEFCSSLWTAPIFQCAECAAVLLVLPLRKDL